MIGQTTIILQNFEGLMAMGVVFFHILISLIVYIKIHGKHKWLLMLLNLMFSIFFGLSSLQYFYSLQIWVMYFDIYLNLILFILSVFYYKNHRKYRRK